MGIEEDLRTIIREELAAALKGNGSRPLEDRLLTAQQAAPILQVSERWLYKHADRLPYAVRLSADVVRFSHNKIQQEIQRRLKAQEKQHGDR
jgi:predicted DNA-binding transcriptional regulator AlpA